MEVGGFGWICMLKVRLIRKAVWWEVATVHASLKKIVTNEATFHVISKGYQVRS